MSSDPTPMPFYIVSSNLSEGSLKISESFGVLRQLRINLCIALSLVPLVLAAALSLVEDFAPDSHDRIPMLAVGALCLTIAPLITLAISIVGTVRIVKDGIMRLRVGLVANVEYGLSLLDVHKLDEFQRAAFELRMIEAQNAIAVAEHLAGSQRPKNSKKL